MGFAALASGGKSHRRRPARYSGSGMGLVRNGFGGAATAMGHAGQLKASRMTSAGQGADHQPDRIRRYHSLSFTYDLKHNYGLHLISGHIFLEWYHPAVLKSAIGFLSALPASPALPCHARQR